jgi:RNA polymerase sigma-70 factor (ECF subfamily)
MAAPHDDHSSPSFATTRWSVVLCAGERGCAGSEQALAELCERYWYPLYAYVRRRVGKPEEARDLTQEFFARLLERNVLAAAQPQRGRFRSFLLVACQNFLANEWARAHAKKRGGGRAPIRLDLVRGDLRFQLEPADTLTPELLYDREWTLTLLEAVLDRLRAEHVDRSTGATFDRLKSFLGGTPPGASQAEAAQAIGLSKGAFKVALHRLRGRYRDLLREEVAQTLNAGEDVDDEIRAMFASLQ